MKRVLASRELLLLAAIGLLLLLIATRFPGFVAPSNLADVFNDTSPLILLAIGQMIVILTKCIDLSVAANLALTGMVVVHDQPRRTRPADHHRSWRSPSAWAPHWACSTASLYGNWISRLSW